jgi:hypothetical protein
MTMARLLLSSLFPLLFIASSVPVNAFDIRPNNAPSSVTLSGFKAATSTALFCQLLGMNCATPTDFTFSLQGFWQRGGETDVHSDGWVS